MASRRGDARAELAAADRIFKVEPGAPGILDRLVELNARVGRTERTDELRGRKAAIDQAAEVYRSRLAEKAPADRFTELAEAAETLGRWFEAKGWRTLATAESPDPSKAREAVARDAAKEAASTLKPMPGKTVADLVADARRRPGEVGRPSFVENREGRCALPGDRAIVPRRREVRRSGRRLPQRFFRPLPDARDHGRGRRPDRLRRRRLARRLRRRGRRPSEGRAAGGLPQRDRLFHNKGDGTFEDVTEKSGLAAFPGGYGHGVTVGDYDGDGRPDLFVTRWRSYALYRNKGDGTFEDATKQAGLRRRLATGRPPPPSPTSTTTATSTSTSATTATGTR